MLGKKTGGRIKGISFNKPKLPTSVPTAVAAAPGAAGGGGAADAPNSFAPQARAHAREATAFPKYRVARVGALIPYVNNPRTHSPAQIAKIAASIKEFGFTNPVLTDGKRGVVAGHGRLLAAEKLGMATVPTIELAHLSKAQRRAYVIADNKLAEAAGWDDELLTLELGDLREEGFDLSLLGFDGPELRALFEEPDLNAPVPGPSDAQNVVCPECGHSFPPP
jgi:hypothetical protein